MEKYDLLLERLSALPSLLVAYSGGVDSTLLAFAAHAVLGEKCLAALALSDTYPPSEAESARRTASHLGLHLIEVETNELADPRFCANPADRCYYCKSELFELLRTVAEARGIAHLADGSNVDDLSDVRPGRRAASENKVLSPLQEAGLTKQEIRDIAEQLSLPNWDKPSMACLASRIPFNDPITEEALQRIARAEDSLRRLGLRQFRVRSHGDVARLEAEPSEMDTAWRLREDVVRALLEAGFTYASLDLAGYRSGSMNEVLQPGA